MPARNVPLLSSAVMLLVTALYVSCPHKIVIRRFLSMMRTLTGRDHTNDVMLTYRLEDTEKWRYVMAPASLKMAARDAVRRALHSHIPRKLEAIGPEELPRDVRRYLGIPELDLLVHEYSNYDYEIPSL